MKELLDYAQNARAHAMQQAEAVQQAQAAGGGIGAVMAALGMDYGTDYVKRVDCPSCGGPKKLASASAYVYCDYCGALADFDFSRACSDASMAVPGPEYAKLVNGLQPQLKAALQAGDRESYRALQRQIFEAYATACPRALSHRISDPDYRANLVDFMAAQQRGQRLRSRVCRPHGRNEGQGRRPRVDRGHDGPPHRRPELPRSGRGVRTPSGSRQPDLRCCQV